jgi:hypothetical protein
MFINIDEGLKEPEWEAYIKDIKEKPETKDTKIGILSYNTDQKLMQKYLMKVGVECGYVQLKLGVKESTRIMLTALEANEARGRRKFIRAECADDSTSTANIKSGTGFFNGKILDISAVGIAAKFDKPIEYNTNQVIPGVQMRLHGSILMTDMIFMGKRADNVAVLLFDPKMPADKKLLVHRYIKQCLQRFMDNLKI